jgi:carboxypeptidase C (cathepsin A)
LIIGTPYLITPSHTETTPGIYQASGYADLNTNEHMWLVALEQLIQKAHSFSLKFWFFEAREDPDNAPLAIWINGGV